MGLSASQTRMLELTARKSNVEYQGQQINQARTALANQTSDLYKELMNLDAPTAPSPYKYVIDPATEPIIDWSDPNAYPLSSAAGKNFEIYYAGNQPSFSDFNIPQYEYCEEIQDENGNVTRQAGYYQKTYNENGKAVYGTTCYQYQEESTDEEGNTIPAGLYTEDGSMLEGTYSYTMTGIDAAKNERTYQAIKVGENENFEYNVTKDGTGLTLFEPKEGYDYSDMPDWIQAYNSAASQYNTYSQPTRTAIYAQGTSEDEMENATPVSYKSSSSNSLNDAQYQAALVQYQQDLEEYEKACEEINAETEEIQESDKKLELQLKQLDTEQESIQTEYEAVKKVIEKNIENSYKTFA